MITINIHDFRWRKFKKPILKNTKKILQIMKCSNPIIYINLLNDREMQLVNNNQRNKNVPTNIISLSTGFNNNLLGEVFLSFETIKKEFLENKTKDKNMMNYIKYLLIHGILHLLGYDHTNDQDTLRMEDIESFVLNTLTKTKL